MEIRSISLKDPNGIALTKDKEVLLERVGRIIMTSPYERINNPSFGSLLFNRFLFDLPNALRQNVNLHLKTVIEKYEPRVAVDTINISVAKDIATININMIIRETFEPLSFEAMVEI